MDIEITSAELRTLPEGEYALIDIRSRTAFDYGHIGGSVNIPENELENAELPQDKRIVLPLGQDNSRHSGGSPRQGL